MVILCFDLILFYFDFANSVLLENFVSYNDHNVIMGKSYSFTVISYDSLSSDGATQPTISSLYF